MINRFTDRFKEWWFTEEPFGFNHPDTYLHIKELFKEADKYLDEMQVGVSDLRKQLKERPKGLDDYYTRLLHQYAGQAMQGLISNPNNKVTTLDQVQAIFSTSFNLAEEMVQEAKRREDE